VFHPPHATDETYIKRVIGLPGDNVEVRAGRVIVNGDRVNEPYVLRPASYTVPPLVVPPDAYFVLGDNRPNSRDSHEGWLVDSDHIIGTVFSPFARVPGWPVRFVESRNA
jgi:signal peptidase I